MSSQPSENLPDTSLPGDTATTSETPSSGTITEVESYQPVDASVHAKAVAPLVVPAISPNLADFYPPAAVSLLASSTLQDIGIYPVFESATLLRATPCGVKAPLPLADPLPGIAKITCKKHDGVIFSASAFLITPQVLLTAGHNLLPWSDPNPANHVMVKKVTVSLPKPGGGLYSVPALRLAVSAQWQGGNVPGRDYGVIFIASSMSYNVPIPPKIVDPFILFPSWSATMSGYPHALNFIYTRTSSFSVSAAGNLIAYQLPSCSGESGAPVYVYTGAEFVAVAVHAYGGFTGLLANISLGVLVDQTMSQELEGWVGVDVCV